MIKHSLRLGRVGLNPFNYPLNTPLNVPEFVSPIFIIDNLSTAHTASHYTKESVAIAIYCGGRR